MIEKYDSEMIRCPRVGGYVNFRLCRSENSMLPCRFVVSCWQKRMDVNQFLKEHFSEEELSRIFLPPRPKIESLVELIEKAKKVKAGNE